MSSRLPIRFLAGALLAATATAVAPGAAHATTVATNPAAHVVAAPADDFGDRDGSGRHHHHHPNCNNDPNSEFAMDPYVCTPSRPTH